MTRLTHIPRKLLGDVQRRFVRSRPGSVLVLVVALLVLMALIGTAYLTMSQSDRVSAQQHNFNTEVELLVDGVLDLVKGTVLSDLYANGPAGNTFRPGIPMYNAPAAAPGVTYNYWNGQGYDFTTASGQGFNYGDAWLDERVPTLGSGGGTSPTWDFISAPLTAGAFDTPYWNPGTVKFLPGQTDAYHYTARTQMVPGSITLPGGLTYPAWVDPSNPTMPGHQILAADADGDGIADSGLRKLPIGTLDGITYYYAVRIIDNCAAVNASVATSPNATSTGGAPGALTGLPGDFSPVSLDLEGMLISSKPGPATELYPPALPNLTSYRWNADPKFGGKSGQQPAQQPIDENGTARSDFGYPTYNGFFYDQMWMQLGRRLGNPGHITGGATSTSFWQALPIGESMTMARSFILRDPNVPAANQSASVLEQILGPSTFNTAPYTPYAPSDTATWYNKNFNYPPDASPAMPIRALLVAHNPVSNFCPSRFTDKGVYGAGPYNFGDTVVYNGHRYVCINSGVSAAPTDPQADPFNNNLGPAFWDLNWAFEPWSTSPTKTSVNTATFQQLYAAYWCVMSDQTPGVPAYQGRMFRSPVRYPAQGGVLSPNLVMQLRAALAAVNTIDLRDSDDDVTGRTISLGGNLYANVFGVEKQPYITEVFAQNDQDPTKQWMAVEIYNPYPTAIPLTNWHFAAYDRTNHTLTDIPLGATPPASIAAGEHMVFVSSATPPANVANLPATDDTQPAGQPFVQVPTLQMAFGKELILFRTRRADGTPNKVTGVPNASYDETLGVQNKWTDLVPVDSYDFTNLPATVTNPTDAQAWHYIRPSDGPHAWHFVYPGRFAFGQTPPAPGGPPPAGPQKPTWEPTVATTVAGGTPIDLSTLGKADPVQTLAAPAQYKDVPIQINNVDFGGPYKVAAANGNQFPFGAFARNGDILQVPFIGSYVLYTATVQNGTTTQNIIEINPVTADSAMATAQDEAGQTQYMPYVNGATYPENVGRFCPIDQYDGLVNIDDLSAASGAAAVNPKWRYHWALKLFDYLTVQCPQDDYLPEVDPNLYGPQSSPPGNGQPGSQTNPFKYLPATANGVNRPQPVANQTLGIANTGLPSGPSNGYNVNNVTEEAVPVEGLVNINTAPWRVLAAVPWVPATQGGGFRQMNAAIAQAIVKYRDVDAGGGKPHGPFRSIFELNDVPVGTSGPLRNVYGNNKTYLAPQYGVISPLTPNPATAVTGDFQSQFEALTRVSNMITTRSDSYTAYVLVQGWRNAETANPTLVVQRRAAIIIDRSTVTPTNPTANVVNVPVSTN